MQIGSKIQEEPTSQIEASQEGVCSKELIITLNLDRKFGSEVECCVRSHISIVPRKTDKLVGIRATKFLNVPTDADCGQPSPYVGRLRLSFFTST